jgi:octopine/nopaline transport system permease protein
MDFAFLYETLLTLLPGIPLTLKLAFSSVAMGAVLALVLALLRMSKFRPLGAIVRTYVFFFRSTPLLVQIFLIYYGLGQFVGVRTSFLWPVLRDPYWCAVIALTLNTAAYGSEIIRGGLQSVPAGQIEAGLACGMSRAQLMRRIVLPLALRQALPAYGSEIIRGGLQSVPAGQIEAGLACGMSRAQLMRRIVLPLALRQALPAYGSEIILMVKATALASIITLLEVTGLAAKLISETYRAIEVFIVAGAIYLILNFVVTRLIQLLEHWLTPHLRPAPIPALAEQGGTA